MPECNTMELMVIAASRILENGASVGVGTGRAAGRLHARSENACP